MPGGQIHKHGANQTDKRMGLIKQSKQTDKPVAEAQMEQTDKQTEAEVGHEGVNSGELTGDIKLARPTLTSCETMRCIIS